MDHQESNAGNNSPDQTPFDADGTPSQAGAPAPAGIGDEVMGILSSVEAQLDRLREVRKTQDFELASLSDRQAALDDQEQTLISIRRQLEQDRMTLESELEALADEQSAFHDTRTQFGHQKSNWTAEHESIQAALIERDAALTGRETSLAEVRAELDDREASLLDTQAQVDALREQAQREHEAMIAESRAAQNDLAALRTELDAAHHELTERSAALEQADLRIGALEKELTSTRRRLEELVDESKSTSASMQKEREELQAAVKDHQRAARHAEERLESILAEHGAARNETKSLAGRVEELQSQIAALENELARRDERLEQSAAKSTTLQESLREHEQRVLEHQEELEVREKALLEARAAIRNAEHRSVALEQQLSERETALADHKTKLEHAGQKLKEFAKAIELQSEQVEKGAAAYATVDQQRRQIERLQTELANGKMGADPEIIARKDERISELTQALRQARGQTAGNPDITAMEARIAEQESAIDRLRRDAESAQLEAENTRRELEEQAKTIAASKKPDSKLVKDNKKLQAEIERLEEAMSAQPGADGADAEALRVRIVELEQSLAEAQKSPAGGTDNAALEEKMKRVQTIAAHLKRRRTRLRQLRQMSKLKNRPRTMAKPGPGMSHDQIQAQMLKLDERRRELIELRAVLAASEKKMIRRWARPRSVLVMMWMIMIATVCAGSSWLVANHFFPATSRAALNIEAKARPDRAMTEAEAKQWTEWHTALLRHQSFRDAVSERMRERKMNDFATADAILARTDDELGIDSSRQGELLLTLTGTDREESMAVLDVIASTLVTESQEQLSARPGTATAAIRNGRRVEGQMRYANIEPVVVSDMRIAYAAQFFGGSFIACLCLMGVFYIKMSHAKRVFEDEDAMFEAVSAR
jgi:chromosome segregation ATPase